MNAGLPRILTKKNTGILDIMIFIIKYCLLLDTNELFVGSKMELNKNIKNNRNSCNEGFDLIDFFTEDLFTDTKFFIGGAETNNGNSPSTQVQETPEEKPQVINDKTKQKRIEEEEKLAKEKEIKNEANEEFQKKQTQKNTLEETAKSEVDAKIEESLSVDTGKKGDEGVADNIIQMIKDVIGEATLTVSNKIKGFLMIFIYASVYPAVPFFAVMAAMLALLKYLFYKVRVF